MGPLYSVAEIPFMSLKPVDDPKRPGQQAYVKAVCQVREPKWEHHLMPDVFRPIMERDGQEPADRLNLN